MIWHNPALNPPPAFADVLLAVRGEEIAAEGFLTDRSAWWFSTGHEIAASEVYAWTEMPAVPNPTALNLA